MVLWLTVMVHYLHQNVTHVTSGGATIASTANDANSSGTAANADNVYGMVAKVAIESSGRTTFGMVVLQWLMFLMVVGATVASTANSAQWCYSS